MRDQLVTLLIAGHETTATTLAWAFELLLQNPQALEKVRQSIRDSHTGGDDSYIDAVISETLRLRPPIPPRLPHPERHIVSGAHRLHPPAR